MSEDGPYDIEISNSPGYGWVDEALLRTVVTAALTRFAVPRAHISIAVVKDEQIAALHQRYHQRPSPTDVLSFNLGEAGAPAAALEGEVVASADTARRAASERGHEPAAELALYAVHGTLHLLGHDDHAPEAARAMHALEDDILTQCGLGPIYGGCEPCA